MSFNDSQTHGTLHFLKAYHSHYPLTPRPPRILLFDPTPNQFFIVFCGLGDPGGPDVPDGGSLVRGPTCQGVLGLVFMINALLSRNFSVRIYTLFPQIFGD